MKKYLFTLVLAVMASTAWAQSPAGETIVITEGAQVVPVSSTAATSAMITGTTYAGTACTSCGGACGSSCATCATKTKTVCVPEPTTMTKTKVLFSSDCETKCHNCIRQLLRHGDDCGSCQEGSCGHAYVVRSLYKRVEKTTCESHKCVPTQVPVCEAPRAATCTTCAKSTCSTGTCGS